MKKKNAKARRWKGVENTCAINDGDKQLAQAIEASKAQAEKEQVFHESLKHALERSEREGQEEAEAFELAIQASLESEQERVVALGLGIEASANLVKTSLGHSRKIGEVEAISQYCVNNCTKPFENTLKVVRGHDVRRLCVTWSSGALAKEIFAHLASTIEKGFCLCQEEKYVLKYCDDEGDLCTLVEETVLDFLEISSRQTSMKLFLEADEISTSTSKTSHQVARDEYVKIVEDGFSIATPLESPRSHETETIEDGEDTWDIIEITS